MTRLKRSIGLATACLALSTGSAHAGAADLELFSATGDVPPNILILLDSSFSMTYDACSGCGSRTSVAKTALIDLVKSVNDPDNDGSYTDNARFGLMEFRNQGATLLHPIQSNATAAMITAINNVGAALIGTPLSGASVDIARYLAGPDEGFGTLDKWGEIGSEDADAWESPWDLSCRKTYVIFISDGEPYNDTMVHNNYWATFGDADGQDGETSSDVGTANFPFADDVAYEMSRHDFKTGIGFDGVQSVIMHVIGFTIDNDLLKDMAKDGQGTYYTTSSASGLAAALSQATSAIYDDQATFSTAVVPTSRTLYDASFYNAFFKPDANAPMWEGHLEAYGLTKDGDIVEPGGANALDATGAFKDPSNPYWDAAEELEGNTARSLYTNKSGARVDFTTANITAADLGLSGVSAVEIAGYPNSSTSGVDTEAKLKTALMQFLYGQDGFDDDDDGNYTEMRSYVLGDIFHSSPRIVGSPSRYLMKEPGYSTFYGNNKDRGRVVYVGANDGMLHAFEAGDYNVGDDPSTAGVVETYWYDQGDGDEIFGFVPGDLLPEVKKVPLNASHGHYFVDGSPAVVDAWLGDGSAYDTSKSANEWHTVMVTGMREGGDSYLALDVTNPGAAGYPGFLWEFTDPDLGQTWSDPIITRVKLPGPLLGTDHCGANDGDGSCVERWVAIFGGGYTPNDEGDPNSGTYVSPATDETGRAIYMVALDDGSLIAKISYDASDTSTDGSATPRSNGLSEMKYAIASTPTVLDMDFDGFADVVYVGDLGGQLWKWDIKAKGPSNWDAGVVFRTPATDMGSGVTHYRNIFFAPSASFSNGALVLAFGTGERQNLRGATDSSKDDENRFYVIRDRYPTGPNAFNLVITEDPTELDDITNLASDPNTGNQGYYIVAREGERFVNDFSTFAGYVQTASYIPTSADPCTAASGESWVYQFDVNGGSGIWTDGVLAADEARRVNVGAGLASAPRISMSLDPTLDQLFIKTSKGKVVTVDPPARDDGNAAMIYWKQNF